MLKYQKKINNNKTLLTLPVCITTDTTKDCMTPQLRNKYWPSNSHEWPRQNFSLQYQIEYNINQISDENKEKYQFGDI